MDWHILLSFGLAILLGIRHGVDWDHIAAITDLVGVEKSSKRGMLLAAMYSLGHGLVILILGSLAIFFGRGLPEWVDFWMEKLVGFTLVALGIWLFLSLFRKHERHMVMSRWKLIFIGAIRIYEWICAKITRTPVKRREINLQVSNIGAFAVGMIHGFGAETPTQIILFTTAAGLGNLFGGLTVVMFFVIGLIFSTSIIALFSTLGYLKVRAKSKLFTGVISATSLYSLIVGCILIGGHVT
ncbi:HoxN/HupN/NixA family nickel/cobalt transporter [Effusibacillus dendaii]|uniref:Nickel/cobalt efflux system n=1 Tax=Effusibacillus dendaii TaxID=2743772 RepID=A0A7I8DCK4_9BACL|nr:High-affinity nickel-transporter [Effusibacillus dendaii]BCJ86689.1 nickel/cobalt efflux system [Effusibacillus dendaii]